jgi:hypothetical protein
MLKVLGVPAQQSDCRHFPEEERKRVTCHPRWTLVTEERDGHLEDLKHIDVNI